MAQETIVVMLPDGARASLEEGLRAAGYEFRSVDHAHFGVRGDGVVATLYRSGKLVVQGADAGFFVERFLPDQAGPEAPEGKLEPVETEVPEVVTTVGSDEAGKGDYFGPLTVAAVKVRAEHAAELRRTGVTDSKKLSDKRIALLAPWIAAHHEHAVERLDPTEYNRAYADAGNLNELLADLHARVLEKLIEPGVRVVVDKFASERLLRQRLAAADIELIQIPRGERELAVAAASVLARNAFVEGIEELSERFATPLHKGAGPPVDEAARDFVTLHGRDALGQVAKLHFKNTAKLSASDE